MALMETLTDPFNQTTLNTTLWTSGTGGTTTISYSSAGASFNLPNPTTSSDQAHIQSTAAYDLTSSHALAQFTQMIGTASGEQFLFQLTGTGGSLRWSKGGTSLGAYYGSSSFTLVGSATYSATDHKWMRTRESGGTVYFDTSPDGVTWNNTHGSVLVSTTGIDITALTVNIWAQTWAAVTDPGILQFNNFNTASSSLSGDAAVALTATVSAGGYTARPGDASVPLSVAAAAAGSSSSSAVGDVAVPLSAGVTADGTVTRPGDITVPLTTSVAASGSVAAPGSASGDTAVALAVAISAPGSVEPGGDITVPLAVAVAASGAVTTSGDAAVSGQVSVSASALRTAEGGTAIPIAADIAVTGLAGTPSDPIAETVLLAAAGAITTLGRVTVPVLAGLEAGGYTETYGGAAASLSVAVSAAGASEPRYALLPHMQAGEPYSQWGAGEPSGQWNASKPSGQWGAGQPRG